MTNPDAPPSALTLRLAVAAREYLNYLAGPKPLGTDEWELLKGRIITLACMIATDGETTTQSRLGRGGDRV